MPSAELTPPPLERTALHALHLELGARMVGFAGYDMPVSYPEGILAEHQACRTAAALFDVSHLGQLRLSGPDAALSLESLVPVDIVGLMPGRQRYGFFTNSSGGILDDLLVTRRDDDLLVIVNAAQKKSDALHLRTNIGHRCRVETLADRSLLALQGPKAVQAMANLDAGVAALAFMNGCPCVLAGIECYVMRSGYTGEDGFEISVPSDRVEQLARKLLGYRFVRPAGLGARDTLRLEAGLCLHGFDIDATVSPIEADLDWAIQPVRRPGGARAGGYPGAAVIEGQLSAGSVSKRVGLVGLERIPVRGGAKLFDAHGHAIGAVTSGTFGPTLGRPIAMAHVARNHAIIGHELLAEVRGRRLPMRVAAMPFTPHRHHR